MRRVRHCAPSPVTCAFEYHRAEAPMRGLFSVLTALPLLAGVVAGVPGHAPATADHARLPGPCASRCSPGAWLLAAHRPDPWPDAPLRAAPARSRPPRTFYLNAVTGRDSNPGTSPGRPWRTIARVDRQQLMGGDRVLFAGGQRFGGTLRLSPASVSRTSPTRVLAIGSYGEDPGG